MGNSQLTFSSNTGAQLYEKHNHHIGHHHAPHIHAPCGDPTLKARVWLYEILGKTELVAHKAKPNNFMVTLSVPFITKENCAEYRWG
ncbi:MAG: hypothetical protein EOP34_08230, partial [Rickettsiales bacterium]